MERLVLIIGGNLGDRLGLIRQARISLGKLFGAERLVSSIFETQAWGGRSKGNYLNQVLVYETAISPEGVLGLIQDIENSLERKREVKWGDRTMDIDILYYGDKVIQSGKLSVPHPYIQDRRFVLVPLTEVMPDFLHPTLLLSQLELLENCSDVSEVRCYEKSPVVPGLG